MHVQSYGEAISLVVLEVFHDVSGRHATDRTCPPVLYICSCRKMLSVSRHTETASYRPSQGVFVSLAGQDRNDDTAAIMSMPVVFCCSRKSVSWQRGTQRSHGASDCKVMDETNVTLFFSDSNLSTIKNTSNQLRLINSTQLTKLTE